MNRLSPPGLIKSSLQISHEVEVEVVPSNEANFVLRCTSTIGSLLTVREYI